MTDAARALAIIDSPTPREAPAANWLAGVPMDPTATPLDPLPALPGFTFLHPGAGALVVGPTGGGRSSLMQACLYDASAFGLRCAYLGSEVTEPEFNARAGMLAGLRGDQVDAELRARLAHIRYLNQAETIAHAWAHPKDWIAGVVAAAYQIVVVDPLSAVASALDLNFDQSNADFIKFYDRLVQPLTARGITVVMVENVGHALEAKNRAKGASAKADRADLTFSCALVANPHGLVIKAHKVRTVRAGFQRGDEWIFHRDSQTIERRVVASTGETEPTFRPTTLMARVSELVAADPGVSKRGIRTGVKGRNEYVDQALRLLLEEMYVEHREDGYHSLRAFDPEAENDGACPERAPDGVPTVPTVPHACPEPCPVPAGDRAHRAIHTKLYGHGGTSPTHRLYNPACNCAGGADEPTADGRCSRCYGHLATAPLGLDPARPDVHTDEDADGGSGS